MSLYRSETRLSPLPEPCRFVSVLSPSPLTCCCPSLPPLLAEGFGLPEDFFLAVCWPCFLPDFLLVFLRSFFWFWLCPSFSQVPSWHCESWSCWDWLCLMS